MYQISDELRAELKAQADERDRQIRSLPCYGHGDQCAAVEACHAAQAFHDCAFREPKHWYADEVDDGFRCPRDVEHRNYDRARERLFHAGVERREKELLLADLTGRYSDDGARVARVPLLETDALKVVRTFESGKPGTVTIAGDNAVTFDGSEAILVLAGAVGVGKTLAACWGLREHRGLYVTTPRLTALDGPIDAAMKAEWLVLDDAGTEHIGASDWAVSRVNEVLSARHSRMLRTIVTTNMRRRGAGGFAERYGERIDSRVGKYIALAGEDLRKRPSTVLRETCDAGSGRRRIGWAAPEPAAAVSEDLTDEL